MITYISITAGDMKTKLFLLKTNVLKFMQQKFGCKNQRKNVLLNFLQMFNMPAFGYTAYIHFLPNSDKLDNQLKQTS